MAALISITCKIKFGAVEHLGRGPHLWAVTHLFLVTADQDVGDNVEHAPLPRLGGHLLQRNQCAVQHEPAAKAEGLVHRHRHLVEGEAAEEGEVADGGARGGEADARERGAAVESVAADGGEAVGQRDAPQGGAAAKGEVAEVRDAAVAREGDGGQGAAAVEGLVGWTAAAHVLESDAGLAHEERKHASAPMEVRPAGRAMEARAEQPQKAWLPMEVRLAGRSMETSEEQSPKA